MTKKEIKNTEEYDFVDKHDMWHPITFTHMHNLEKTILSYIRILGLPDKQEEAFSTAISSKIWATWREIVDNSWTSEEEKLKPIIVDRYFAPLPKE